MAVFRLQVGGDVDSRGAEKYPITIPMKNTTRPMPMHGIIIFLVFTSTIMYPAIPMFQKKDHLLNGNRVNVSSQSTATLSKLTKIRKGHSKCGLAFA